VIVPKFMEIAHRVWVARYEWEDVNVTAIGSERGLVVVDTHGSTAAGRNVVMDLDRLGAGPVVHVVNSHWHWDHSFGNAAFREVEPGVPIHAHKEAAIWLADQGERMKQRFTESPDHPHGQEIAATELVIPDQTFSEARTLDLGDRELELVFAGRGHTSGDIVVRVRDADVLIAGDLIEESAKPWIGMDSWPLEWPATLDVVLKSISERTVVIPGHGVAVDRTFVRSQRDEMAQIVTTVRTLAGLGVPADCAVAEGEWPWAIDDRILNAVRRGYETIAAPPLHQLTHGQE
jgi:glyoxylase-like metal-dependent hydrolase (beta-lactamase superfamily II)